MTQPALDSSAPQRCAAPRPGGRAGDTEAVAVPETGRFEGLLSFRGSACVLGGLRGAVEAAGTLRIGPVATVEARIEVDELIVEGRVRGVLYARSRLVLTAGAEVEGQLHAPRIELREGCRFRGPCCSGARASDGPPAEDENPPLPS